MTDYIVILESQTDPSAPVNSPLMKALAKNPTALAEGAPGAPAIQFPALGRLVAGAVPRTPLNSVDVLGDTLKTIYSFFMLQEGTIRCRINYISGSGGTMRVRRKRNGVTTTMGSKSASGSDLVVDVPVIHGDLLIFEGSADATTDTVTFESSLETDGGPLWSVNEGVDNAPV